MELRRRSSPKALISLVPMIDVMLIMLIFFMVTSTYLNLDMIPVGQPTDTPPEASRAPPAESAGPTTDPAAPAAPVLIRLGADGRAYVRGRALDGNGLRAMIAARMAADPQTRFIVLPSGEADLQSLVTLMDTATRAGATALSVVRLVGRP